MLLGYTQAFVVRLLPNPGTFFTLKAHTILRCNPRLTLTALRHILAVSITVQRSYLGNLYRHPCLRIY